MAYVGFRVWLLRLLVWSRHLCFYSLQSTCQPHHTTLLVSLKTVVVLAHWSSLPEVHRGVYPGALSFFETLADVLLCPALSCTALFTHSGLPCTLVLPRTGARSSRILPGAGIPEPCAVPPGALALLPPAGGSAFALVPCSGTCHMISHVTGIYSVRCMVSILKEKGKQEELQQD